MTANIYGLEERGLTLNALRARRRLRIRIHVYLVWPKVTAKLLPLTPKERGAWLDSSMQARWRTFSEEHADLTFKRIGKPKRPAGARATVPVATLEKLRRNPLVAAIWIDAIPGHPRKKRRPKLGWYSVRAWVCIQIEGRESGLEELEDRIVLVQATSFDDAERRLAREWREYANPYLNPEGRFVRWQLDEVVDVYYVGNVDEIDPRGTEVWSSLDRRRRIRPKTAWRPQKTGLNSPRTAGKSKRR